MHTRLTLMRVGIFVAAVSVAATTFCRAGSEGFQDRAAGKDFDGLLAEADGKLVHPAGSSLRIPGEPIDVVLAPNGSVLFVKTDRGLTVVDAQTFRVIETFAGKDDDGSMHGLAVTAAPDSGCAAYFTTVSGLLLEVDVSADGHARWRSKINLGSKHPWGVAVSNDQKFAYVCLSVESTLAVVDLRQKQIVRKIAVGVAPYDVVLSPDGDAAYVTNYGGHPPGKAAPSEKSVGVDVAVDERSIPNSGTVCRVDLRQGRVTAEIKTGLHPTQIIRDAQGARYFVADANSDSISVIDAGRNEVCETILVRPDPGLAFGSVPDGLALGDGGRTLYVANAGNDAVAVVSLGTPSKVRGFIPTGWFPGGIAASENFIYVANTKSGTLSRVAAPAPAALEGFSRQVMSDERVPHQLQEFERSKSAAAPVPVPVPIQPGTPSVFKHVVYVLKENKKYDQVLGDIGKGNSDAALCIFGQRVTPNQHALANAFVLLDNYYCNGVVSSDGHQWATQGMIGDYYEKGSRTYDFGTDALCYVANDFIWDSCLLHGLSVRNYGEFDFPIITSKATKWFDIYRDWDRGLVSFRQSVQLSTLMRYTCHEYPGWNLAIPDACRLEVFLKEFSQFEKSGELPNFLLVYLPQDHTYGSRQDAPSPRAMVADNDLATGKVVETLSKSRFWKDTCIFINEDDPQTGEDHVDGHRSFCLIASPYTKRGAIVSRFYNQTSVLHTMTNMLGLPPLNQQCAESSTMEDCFTNKADFTPFRSLPNQIPLDEKNPRKQAMAAGQRALAEAVERMDFSRPDRINPDTFSRLLWSASGRTDRYPAEFDGAHGKGLPALHLALDKTKTDEDGDGD